MRTEALTRLYHRFVSRSQELRNRFGCPLPNDPYHREMCSPVHKDGRAHLVVRLQHLWGEFSRELVVRSAAGGCCTRTGQALPRMPIARNSAYNPKTIRNFMAGPKTYWYDPKFAITQAKDLKVANLLEIDLGLGSANLTEIKCIRNYIVHPNRFTRADYLRLTRNHALTGLEPDLFLAQRVIGGATMFDTWIEDLLIAAWNAVE